MRANVATRGQPKSCAISRCFFFFSSRRRHTRWPRVWSSDVCSSDLTLVQNARFDTFAEIIKRFEFPLTQTRFTNRFGGVLANILDRGETEANGFSYRREVEIAFI